MAETDKLDGIDWKAVEQETVQTLQRLIRFETVNPPGNEDEAARWVQESLKKEGYDPIYVESAPRRGNIIARHATGGKEKPILLNAHLDVVPASAKHWKYPPFSGAVQEGCVWGRGALDMKGMAAMCMSVLRLLKRRNVKLNRDIIFAATADEEAGGIFGPGYLVEKHPDLIRAEYFIGEVGGFTLHLGKKKFYPIQVAERGLCWMKIRTKGDPGHGSIPHNNQAVVKLARIADRLERNPFPAHLLPVVKKFWRTVGENHPFPLSLVFRLFALPGIGPFLVRTLVPAQQRRPALANFSHTACMTVVRAGVKTNVIPDEAEAEIDGRILPGYSVDQFLDEFKSVIDEEVEIEPIIASEGLIMPDDTPLFKALADSVRKFDPSGIPLPYMIPGMTDARHFSQLGMTTYGFSPMLLPADLPFNQLFHGHNERVPVEALGFGVRVLMDALTAFCR